MNLIIFDGLCNLCNHSVLFIIKRDPKVKFKFTTLQSEVGQAVLNNHNIPSYKIASIVYIKDDKYFFQSSAILNILRDLGEGWRLFYVFIIVPPFIRDFVYNLIANSRYKLFGKRDKCMTPNDGNKNRFL